MKTKKEKLKQNNFGSKKKIRNKKNESQIKKKWVAN